MLDSITFKTDLGEIIAPEEVAVLFDSIEKKYTPELVSLSIFPLFNQLREEIIEKTLQQRNSELSKLLSEITNRKQKIKINMWQTLGSIGNSKKEVRDNTDNSDDLEQIMYEEEQIINAYENSIKTLENKEKRIMNGRYSRIDNVNSLPRRHTLKKQLEELKKKVMEISDKHDNCFKEFEDKLSKLIENTIITTTTFSKSKKNISTSIITAEQYANSQSMTINNTDYIYNDDENKIRYIGKNSSKDFYLYEPSAENPDDELIYQLLMQGKYDDKDGTINAISFISEYEYSEEM